MKKLINRFYRWLYVNYLTMDTYVFIRDRYMGETMDWYNATDIVEVQASSEKEAWSALRWKNYGDDLCFRIKEVIKDPNLERYKKIS